MRQRFFLGLMRKSWLRILLLALLGVGASACGVSLSLVSKQVVDIATGQAEGELIRIGSVLAVIIVFQLLLQVVLTVLHVHTTAGMRFRMQADLFDKLLQKQKLSVDRFHSGELVNRLSGDTTIVADGLTNILPSVASVGARILFSFLALTLLDPILAVVCIFVGILMMIGGHFYRKKTGDLFKQSRESEGRLRSFLQDAVQSLPVIKAFSVFSVMQRQLRKAQDEAYLLVLKKNKISIFANVCFYVFLTASYYGILAWGAWRIATGQITFGTLTAMLSLTGDITTPFRQLASVFPQYMAVCASAERLEELELLEDDAEQSAEDSAEIYKKMVAISVDNVDFTYGDGLVLDHVSAYFPKEALTAVTGESGAGKSTLLNLLIGLLKPQTGNIRVETENGEFPLAPHRRMLAYVPQDFLLLSGDVLQNVTLFDENPNMERFWKAVQMAELEEEVKALPDGIYTKLGESGGRLSGGQRQRMAIARAVYSGAKVFLMDESTSAVSWKTEKKILSNFRENACTVIFVTHRKTAIELCDRLLVVKDRTIYEEK